jgi:hypothetical protein
VRIGVKILSHVRKSVAVGSCLKNLQLRPLTYRFIYPVSLVFSSSRKKRLKLLLTCAARDHEHGLARPSASLLSYSGGICA